MNSEDAQIIRSLEWLKANYSHIWDHPYMSLQQKAGFLAACCDSRRCCLAQHSLMNRLIWIENALLGVKNP